jgi:Zn-dependent protease
MVFQKRSWLLILLLLALVGAIAFPIIHISKTENLYPIVSSYGYGYMNQVGELVIYPQFDRAEKFSQGFAPVKVKDKLGFVNFKGQVSITLPNNIVDESNSGKHESGVILPRVIDKHSGEYDEYDTLSTSFSEGLAGVTLNGKWGFINQNGKLVIPDQFDEVQKFSGGVATVKVGDLWGVINPEGKWIIQPVNKYPIQFFQGIGLSLIDNIGDPIPIIYYWDKSGHLVGSSYNRPQLAKEFQEEMAIIEIPWRAWQEKRDVYPVVAISEDSSVYSIGSKCGFQDKQGKVVIKPQFDGCQNFSQGLAAVRVDKKWGYINKTGKFIISPQFDFADSFFEERGLIVSNGKIGFIDKTGKVVIKPEFDPNLDDFLRTKFKEYPDRVMPRDVMPYRFSSGLAVVSKDDKCGYIDKTGKFAIEPQFISCERFDSYGIAQAKRKYKIDKHWDQFDQSFYITRGGKIIPQYIINEDSLRQFYPARIILLISVLACLLWIVAISCHEFAHAIVAYWGGDHSIKDKGYLSFNPRLYIHPLPTIILPAFFLLIGGIPLPGAAVYIEFDQIRNRLWASATAAAGPIASLLFGLILVPIFHIGLAWNFPYWFLTFIAAFINLQFVTALFNLLPIPPLDGYRIISVWLPSRLQDRSGIASLIGLLFICFVLPFISISSLVIILPVVLMLALGISDAFSMNGLYLLDRWYMALCLLVAAVVYLIYKPASIFQIAGHVLGLTSPKTALKMYERAIKLDPKNAVSWEGKAVMLNKLQTFENRVEIISALETAIELNPHNIFLQKCLQQEQILQLMLSSSDKEQLKAMETYTESYPQDAWGWAVKAGKLESCGRDEEALLAWEKYLEFNSKNKFKLNFPIKESTLEALERQNKL